MGIGGLQSTSIPLPSILPQSLPGCDALVSLDALYLLLPSGGVASTEIPIPPASLYIGKQFYYQVVALELDMSMTIVAAASSNGLELIVGSY